MSYNGNNDSIIMSISRFFNVHHLVRFFASIVLSYYVCRVSENNIGAPEMQNNFDAMKLTVCLILR